MQVCEILARPFPQPEPDRAVNTVAQFFDNEAGRSCAIHKDAHVGPLDNGTGVKPLIAVELRDYRPFVLAGAFRPKNLPRPRRLRNILHGMAVALRRSLPCESLFIA